MGAVRPGDAADGGEEHLPAADRLPGHLDRLLRAACAPTGSRDGAPDLVETCARVLR